MESSVKAEFLTAQACQLQSMFSGFLLVFLSLPLRLRAFA
jgi:hypothetical protein